MTHRARTRIKICGLRSVADVEAAVDAGADAIGIVHAAGSPRQVDAETAGRLRRAAGPFVTVVSVFRDDPPAKVGEAVAAGDWDVVCHGRRWIEHYLLDEATEREEIARAYDSIRDLTGRAPDGWYCRYAPSPATRPSSPALRARKSRTRTARRTSTSSNHGGR